MLVLSVLVPVRVYLRCLFWCTAIAEVRGEMVSVNPLRQKEWHALATRAYSGLLAPLLFRSSLPLPPPPADHMLSLPCCRFCFVLFCFDSICLTFRFVLFRSVPFCAVSFFVSFRFVPVRFVHVRSVPFRSRPFRFVSFALRRPPVLPARDHAAEGAGGAPESAAEVHGHHGSLRQTGEGLMGWLAGRQTDRQTYRQKQ